MSEFKAAADGVLSELADQSTSALACDESGRHEERYLVTGEVDLVVTSNGSIIRGRLLNISASGCYVQTIARTSLAPGEIVKMVICVKGSSNLQIVAEARFSKRGVGKGFRFLKMTPETRQRLSQVIDNLTPRKVEVALPRVWHDDPK